MTANITDDEVVEAVARALYDDNTQGEEAIEWEELKRDLPYLVHSYYRRARAAIAAYENAKGEK